MGKRMSWIGVDLDGTLVEYTGWKGVDHLGAPVPLMVDRVNNWLEAGETVKIFTARVCGLTGDELDAAVQPIAKFCLEHFGRMLDITCVKDFGMIELWDDRAVQVEANTGKIASPQRSSQV